MMPSFFIAHGAPSIVLEDNEYTRFLKNLASLYSQAKAVVLFSAHWESPFQQIGAAKKFETIYDFSGFSPELYQIQYPAVSDEVIAKEIHALFTQHEIPCEMNTRRGLDHGAWAVLQMLYPKADKPVISLSIDPNLSNKEQYRIGKALAYLRERDVLIIGSGGTVHNLRRLDWDATQTNEWALTFDQWIEDKIIKWDTASLFKYEKEAPFAKEAVPRNEHFIPLLLAMGSGDKYRNAVLMHRSYQYGNLSLSCWRFD
jgi:4,5-DOPA dioxygenase extradiol